MKSSMQKKIHHYLFLKSLPLICSKTKKKRKYVPKILYIYKKNKIVKWFYCLFKVIPLCVGRIISLKFLSFIPGPFIFILLT